MTERRKEKLVQIWMDDGMPEVYARRQVERLERGEAVMDDQLALRMGRIRVLTTDEEWYRIFDISQDGKTFEQLPEADQRFIEAKETEYDQNLRSAGLI